MEPEKSLVIYIVSGQCAVLLWVVSVLLRNGTQIAVLQKTVDELTEDMRSFLKKEVDTLTILSDRITTIAERITTTK